MQEGNNCNERVCLITLIVESIECGGCLCKLLISLGVSLLLFFTCYFDIEFCSTQRNGICQSFIDVFSCIIGFIIAGYAILLSISDDTVKKLCNPDCTEKLTLELDDKEKVPPKNKEEASTTHFDRLCASFTNTCILLIVTIILSIIYKNRPVDDDWYILFLIIGILGIISFIMTIDIVFHLYTLSTYIRNPKKKMRSIIERFKTKK